MKKISLEEIRQISCSVFDFLKDPDLAEKLEKKYEFDHGIYINVESYQTQDKKNRKYEAHKRYVDIQFIIAGKEMISGMPVKDLDICDDYDTGRDIAFYDSNESGNDFVLESGEALIIFPEEGHMPSLNIRPGVPGHVKKAVVKVPVILFKDIKYLVMDVDGTLTDGKIYMGRTGEVCKAFHIKDGFGIHDIAIPNGIIPVIITGRKSDILLNRCRELGIERIYQGVSDKIAVLRSISESFSSIAYIGDDINDLSCMVSVKEAGGIVGCPKDAAKKVLESADYIADHNGGDGAVRDFIEWIVR